jgi:hypothetical protein
MHDALMANGQDVRAMLIALVSTDGFVQRAEDQ